MTRIKQISKLGVKQNYKANYAVQSRMRCVKQNPLEPKDKSVKARELALKYGVPAGTRTRNLLLRRQKNVAKLLNKLSVTELAQLSNLSKSYISQVKHGRRPPS